MDEDLATNSVWEHPLLGQFVFNNNAWVKMVEPLALDTFTYSPSYLKKPYIPSGRYPLQFLADDPAETPSTAAADLAIALLAAQEQLVSMIIQALWEDINGSGPDSGMWWHGGLDEITGNYEDPKQPPLRYAEDLRWALSFSSMVVRPSVSGTHKGSQKPVAELCFDALFEQEHGIGILTDGKTILGIGYMVDVSPFKP